ncbi:hypothetical protein Smp_087220 [Schistosoma mansoni]|uniref:hypothetical protein n=1 Tax=Schistosoma mansoni TaxID=6183 RepID=UPI00022DC593|nr:hypothetical protein Smp_087220 [Schistosoma mansoni]|eukprot:XP_018652174.1 hypothetical protein Smp_087220 [Schistosoma mansoni]
MDVQLWDGSLDDEKDGANPSGTIVEEDFNRDIPNVNSNINVRDGMEYKRKRSVIKERRFVINDMVETVDFGLLPEGWLQLRHISGLNVYLHRSSRVVTLSRPYSIGPSSVRHHRIPVSAIPCLAYRKASGKNFYPTESHKVPSKFTSPVNELNNKTVCCPFEKSPTNIPSEDIQTIQKLDLSHESLEDEVSVINNKHEDKLPITDDISVSFTSSRNNLFSLPEDNNNHDFVDVMKSKNSDKEEGELSSGDDERENSFEDDSRAKKPHLNNDNDVSGGVGEDSINCSSNETLSLRDSLPKLVEEVPSTCNNVVYNKPTHFGNRYRKFRRGNLTKRSCLTSSNIQLSESDHISNLSANTQNEAPTGTQEIVAVKTQVFSIKDKEKESLLTPDDIREYCGRLFEIRVEDTSEQAKVIRYQIPSTDGNISQKQPKEGMINMTGKSYVCILHEYCQNVIRRPPTYQTTVLENEKNPYQMTVFINGNPYGTGAGQSKKCARLEAARKALEVLIPDFQKIVCNDSHQTGPVVASDRDMQLFDSISVTDPRLYELSVRMALPTPYNLLVECLNRSCVPESDLKSNMISQGRSKHFFTLQLREHTVKVRCKNKREGRHLSAQHLLARLHPEVNTWSGLLRMYGPGSKPDKRNELETIQDAQTQQKSAVKASLIRLLKAKMSELADQWEKSGGSLNPKGKFFVSPYNLPVVAFHPDSEGDLYSSAPIASSSSPTIQPSTSD